MSRPDTEEMTEYICKFKHLPKTSKKTGKDLIFIKVMLSCLILIALVRIIQQNYTGKCQVICLSSDKKIQE